MPTGVVCARIDCNTATEPPGVVVVHLRYINILSAAFEWDQCT